MIKHWVTIEHYQDPSSKRIPQRDVSPTKLKPY